MGWLDRFKRKPAAGPRSLSLGRRGGPRCHHYTMAHRALRSVAFSQPLMFFGGLASPDAHKLLEELIVGVTQHCAGREARPDFTVDEITIHPMRAGGRICVVIEMPPPRAMTEVYFVAAVLMAEPTSIAPTDENLPVRYFTLEFSEGKRTVLCEWTSAGAHMNYGDGPTAEVPAFVAAVETMLAKA